MPRTVRTPVRNAAAAAEASASAAHAPQPAEPGPAARARRPRVRRPRAKRTKHAMVGGVRRDAPGCVPAGPPCAGVGVGDAECEVRPRGGGRRVPLEDWAPGWARVGTVGRRVCVGGEDVEVCGEGGGGDDGVYVRHCDPLCSVGSARVGGRSVLGDPARDWEGWADWVRADAWVVVRSVVDGVASEAVVDLRVPGVGVAVVFLVRARALDVAYEGGVVRFSLAEGPRDAAGGKLCVARALVVRWALARRYAGMARDEVALDMPFLCEAVGRRGDTRVVDAVRGAAERLPVTLRPYQERAVSWMVEREVGGAADEMEPWVVWREEEGGEVACLNPVSGEACFGAERPPQGEASCVPRGGMLCDEMGLGKTVEVLTLVLANPRPEFVPREVPAAMRLSERKRADCAECGEVVEISRGGNKGRANNFDPLTTDLHQDWILCRECRRFAHRQCSGVTDMESDRLRGYVCARCCTEWSVVDHDAVRAKSNATLVVAPLVLLTQWRDELVRHGPEGLDVVVFEGLKGPGGYVPMYRLLNADVVLTTYAALQSDVSVLEHMRSDRTMRYKRTYTVPPTPLVAIEWWRMCVDEAQMVSNANAAAKMAQELSACARWCVTGTPIRHHVTELAGYLKFLRAGPLADKRYWEAGVVEAAMDGFATDVARLQRLLLSLVWRTNKADVEGTELQLPPQHVEVNEIELGVVERYFYNEVLRATRAELDVVDNVHVDELIGTDGPIERLRQACCHPQVGVAARRILNNGVRANRIRIRRPIAKNAKGPRLSAVDAAQMRAENPMSMAEVLDSLIARARVQAEDALRSFAASSNGLAGAFMLMGGVRQLTSAILTYRDVLDYSVDNMKWVQLDSIQRLHVLENLQDSCKRASSLKRYISNQQNGTDQALVTTDPPGEEYTDDKPLGVDISMMFGSAAESSLVQSDVSDPAELLRELDEAMALSEEYGHIPDEIAHLRRNYVRESRLRCSQAMASFTDASAETDELLEECDRVVDAGDANTPPRLKRAVPWWSEAVGIILEDGDPELFTARVVGNMMEAQTYARAGEVVVDDRSLAAKLHSFSRVDTIVAEAVEDLFSARHACFEMLQRLPGSRSPSKEEILQSGQCAECRGFDSSGKRCEHCKAESLLTAFESTLYNTAGRKDAAQKRKLFQASSGVSAVVKGALRRRDPVQAPATAYRGRSELESLLRGLAAYARQLGSTASHSRGQTWLRMLDALKKEFDLCRIAFDEQKNYLGDLDELEQAVQRVRTVPDGVPLDELPRHEQLFTVHAHMAPLLRTSFANERASGRAALLLKKGNLVYLSSLAQRQHSNAHQCAICFCEPDKMALLECGHVFCADCTTTLMERRPGSLRFACPTCRRVYPTGLINFVVRREVPSAATRPASRPPSPEPELDFHAAPPEFIPPPPLLHPGERRTTFYDADIEVSGAALSAKVSAVVRTVKTISRRTPLAKTLVFSQWREVLNIVSSALRLNEVTHAWLGTRALADFKSSAQLNVLLAPLAACAAGLNVVEATHVVLVEPALNPTLEAQAISRVHRISQTRETFVHRLVVRDTVEGRVRAAAAQGFIASDEVQRLLR